MWQRLFVLALGVALAAGAALVAAAVEPETEAAAAAVAYIESLQNPDGGFPVFGEESSPGSTIDAIFAFAAFDVPPDGVALAGASPLDYLETQAAIYATDPGAAAKLALAVSYVGIERLSDFGGVDLLAVMDAALDPETGAYGLDLFDHAFYMFASMMAGGNPAPQAVDYLFEAQQADGGWEFTPSSGSDSNTTAMALQALIAAGEQPGRAVGQDAFAYLESAQNDDGGFGFLPGEPTDPNSTALVIQALAAAGADIGPGGRWAPEGVTPLEALLSFQDPETGTFQYAGADSPFATYQAVPGLMLAPFPGLETQVFVPPTTALPPVDLVAPATPSPTVPVGVLPPTGAGPVDGGQAWGVLAALIAAGAAATGAAVAVRWR